MKIARIKRAIQLCLDENIYPSARDINQRMGRNTTSLSGEECIVRRKLFKEMDIELKGSRVKEYDTENGTW